jgi:diguanylate cyclase (GGDEF)-like protein
MSAIVSECTATMFAALSASNQAIIRSQTVEEAFQKACEAAVQYGGFRSASVLVPNQDNLLEFVAFCAETGARPGSLEFPLDENTENGANLCSDAFRTQRCCISNDYQSEDQFRPLIASGFVHSVGSLVCAPLISNGTSVGVFLFSLDEAGALKPSNISLLEQMAENLSYAFGNFEKEKEQRRIARMLAALSATNEAIMRAKSRDELYQTVCEAAVEGAKFTTAAIFLIVPGQKHLETVGKAGPNLVLTTVIKISLDPNVKDGKTIGAISARTGKTVVDNDFQVVNLKPEQYRAMSLIVPHAAIALPLFSGGRVVGVLRFMASEKKTFTPQFVKMLEGLSENISFALQNFDKADAKKRAEERISYLADHDTLTGLPNRAAFYRMLDQAVKTSKRRKEKCALMFVDLDRFKIINDSLGHDAGDALLIEVAKRLKASVRESDVVARLGGDEFVVILHDIKKRDDAGTVAQKLLLNLIPSTKLLGHECRTTGSIGISVYPEHGDDSHSLIKNADLAMYLAKEEGKNNYRFFSTEIKTQSIERLMLETGLRQAIELEQFTLHYQPKINAATNTVTGVEALLRWNHPTLGSLPPMKFIPLAEETGLIVPIGRWVLRTACAQNMAWIRQGLPRLTMAVNLSPRQFLDQNLLHDVDDILAETGMPAELLELEITESMVMQNMAQAILLLDQIQSRGIRLSLDDFGTGYSSMSMMKRFPIDTIKIDRSFVRDLGASAEDRAITTAIIDMGRALGLTVVAEGVETEGQNNFLRKHACTELQGFLFSKPVPPDELEAFLRNLPSPSIVPALDPTLLIAGPVRLPGAADEPPNNAKSLQTKPSPRSRKKAAA